MLLWVIRFSFLWLNITHTFHILFIHSWACRLILYHGYCDFSKYWIANITWILMSFIWVFGIAGSWIIFFFFLLKTMPLPLLFGIFVRLLMSSLIKRSLCFYFCFYIVNVLWYNNLKHINKIWTYNHIHISNQAFFCVVQQNLMNSPLKCWLQNGIGKCLCELSALY